MDNGPRYRLQHGRPPKGTLTAPPTRVVHIALPIELFDDMLNDCREPDVALALSFMLGQAYVTDYVRAAILVFHRLLRGASRERLLSFTNLPEDRVESVIAHLEFDYAALPGDATAPHVPTEPHPGINPTKHAEMYRRAEGIEDKPAKTKAPLKEKDPWNRL